MYSVGEHPTLSEPVTVDLATVFAEQGFTIATATETSLTGNQAPVHPQNGTQLRQMLACKHSSTCTRTRNQRMAEKFPLTRRTLSFLSPYARWSCVLSLSHSRRARPFKHRHFAECRPSNRVKSHMSLIKTLKLYSKIIRGIS